MTRILLSLPIAALAACGGDAPAPAAQETKPATLPAGEWEITSIVERLQSTDNSTPDVALKEGQSAIQKVCIGETDGKPDLTVLMPSDDRCNPTSVYAKNGRINASYNCTRPGKPGSVMPSLDGKFTVDTLELVMTTGTYFSGSGDYALTQKITGNRLGDCQSTAG